MIVLLAAHAFAAEPLCTEVTRADFLEGEHFWIEWDPGITDPKGAQAILDWAEEARRTYVEDYDYPFTDHAVLIRIEDADSQSGGLTTTTQCPDGSWVPLITLFATEPDMDWKNTTMHEVFHGATYVYTETYLNAISDWATWLEGSATWMTTKADPNLDEFTPWARIYFQEPWTGLHQDATAYVVDDRLRFLYSTSILAAYVEEHHGVDAIKTTWEYAESTRGEPVYFPDAFEYAGIDWTEFWQGWMAAVTVHDLPHADEFWEEVHIEKRVGDLPAEGAPKNARRPAGMGLSIVHFRRAVGRTGESLDVHIEGDPEIPWMAVLVRTNRKGPGGKVLEVVPVEIGADGVGDGSLADFDGADEGYLVVSPQDATLIPRDFTWRAQMSGIPVDEEKKGCGCWTSGGAATGWVALLVGALVVRRRESRR